MSHPFGAVRSTLVSLRGTGLLVAVLALLVFANLSQADGDARDLFRATAITEADDFDGRLAGRWREVAGYAVAEYTVLVVAGLGGVVALAGPRAVRLLERGAQTKHAHSR